MLLRIILKHVEGLKNRLSYPLVPEGDEIGGRKYTRCDEITYTGLSLQGPFHTFR